MTSALLLYNPAAGKVPSFRLAERAAQVLRSHGWQVDIEQTQSGEHIADLARQAAHEGLDVLVVAGGDGSIGQAVAGLAGAKTALGVLPAGTSNVWAQELGLPRLMWSNLLALEQAAGRLASAPIQAVDVGMCNGMPFLLWAGVGLDGEVIYKLEGSRQGRRQLAVTRYAASLLRTSYTWDGLHLEVQADGNKVEGQYILALASNIRNYAGGFAQVSPQVCLDDGLMDLWLFSGEKLSQVVMHGLNLLTGRHVHSDDVEHIPFRHLLVRSDTPMHFHLDGDPAGANPEVEIDVRQCALRVLVPPQASSDLFSQPADLFLTEQSSR
jgi:YegS/Rv2252/BmrU family lipid kinase